MYGSKYSSNKERHSGSKTISTMCYLQRQIEIKVQKMFENKRCERYMI